MHFLRNFLETKLPLVFTKTRLAWFFISGRTSLRIQEKKLSKMRDTKGKFNLKIQYKREKRLLSIEVVFRHFYSIFIEKKANFDGGSLCYACLKERLSL